MHCTMHFVGLYSSCEIVHNNVINSSIHSHFFKTLVINQDIIMLQFLCLLTTLSIIKLTMQERKGVTNKFILATIIKRVSGVARLSGLGGRERGRSRCLRGQIWALPHSHCLNSQLIWGARGGQRF